MSRLLKWQQEYNYQIQNLNGEELFYQMLEDMSDAMSDYCLDKRAEWKADKSHKLYCEIMGYNKEQDQ